MSDTAGGAEAARLNAGTVGVVHLKGGCDAKPLPGLPSC